MAFTLTLTLPHQGGGNIVPPPQANPCPHLFDLCGNFGCVQTLACCVNFYIFSPQRTQSTQRFSHEFTRIFTNNVDLIRVSFVVIHSFSYCLDTLLCDLCVSAVNLAIKGHRPKMEEQCEAKREVWKQKSNARCKGSNSDRVVVFAPHTAILSSHRSHPFTDPFLIL